MKYEALLWVGVIMATPVWYMLSRTFFALIFSRIFRSEKITLEVRELDGSTSKKVFRVNKSDELIALLDEVTKNQERLKRTF